MRSKIDIDHVDDLIDQASMIISAAENWAAVYTKHPQSHAKIIRLEAKIARIMRKYFRDLAHDRVWKYINWTQYHSELIKAYDVNVIFDNSNYDESEGDLLLGVVHDPLLDGMGIGIAAGQEIYNRDIGMTASHEAVLKTARQYSAGLVKDVNTVTRNRIQQSITTSLKLGEDQTAAATRISGIVNDPKRAETIARTEAVNSYSKGLLSFGNESGAAQKEWQDLGANDECADNSSDGPIDIGGEFSSGDDAPPAHPNCRCGIQLIYTDANGDEITTDVTDDGSDL